MTGKAYKPSATKPDFLADKSHLIAAAPVTSSFTEFRLLYF